MSKILLPSGLGEKGYLQRDEEWPRLKNRLGKQRILDHALFQNVMAWYREKFAKNPDDFNFFEAGCGHGNDLRAFRAKLFGKGNFLGVDFSEAEIIRGIKFYGETMEEAQKVFVQGDLFDLKNLLSWDQSEEKFSLLLSIDECMADLIYMEAVLHAFGYGFHDYSIKKYSAQIYLDEVSRICKNDGRFFGRVNVFGPGICKDEQFELLRRTENWRFMPEAEEFIEMLESAGFKLLAKPEIFPHEKAASHPDRKHVCKLSFLAGKA